MPKKYNEEMSVLDAFLALEEIEDDEEYERLVEGKTYSINDPKELEKAKEARDTENQTKDVTLEVIDPDADAVEHMKNATEYIGQMLLQCNTCKATKFIDMDKLVATEGNEQVYNLEDECPHCHHEGAGYTLIGQVGKAEEDKPEEENTEEENTDDVTFENDEKESDATFENEAEEAEVADGSEEDSQEEEEVDKVTPEEVFAWDETPEVDDTEDMEDTTGDIVDENDVPADDTEEEDEVTEEETEDETEEVDDEETSKKKKVKKEEFFHPELTTLIEAYGDEKQEIRDLCYELGILNMKDLNTFKDEMDLDIDCSNEELLVALRDYRASLGVDWKRNDYHLDTEKFDFDYEYNESEDKPLEEELDLSSWEGTVESFLERFTLLDERLSVKFFNVHTQNLIASYDNIEDVPFELKIADVVQFNTDDNYLQISVCEPELTDDKDVVTVYNVFSRFNHQAGTIYMVTNEDTDETEEFEELEEVIERFGVMNVVGTIGAKAINFYIDKDVEEHFSIVNSKSHSNSYLVDAILHENNLKLSNINKIGSKEWFINEGLKLDEDLKYIFENFVAPTNNQKLITRFVRETGYKDKVQTLIEEIGIDREIYNKVISASTIKEEASILPEVHKVVDLYGSAATRKELAEELEKLKLMKLPYKVTRSKNENYRYDIYVDRKALNESIEELDTYEFENEFNLDANLFTEEVQNFLDESYDENEIFFLYKSHDIKENGIIEVKGILEGYSDSKLITFTLNKKMLSESTGSEVGYTVSNDISEEVFDYIQK